MRRSLAAAAAFQFLLALPSAAQLVPGLPLSLELRGGAGIPPGDFAVEETDADLQVEAGPALSGGLALHFAERFLVYGGYNWTGFGCSECSTFELDGDVVDAGFGAGAGAEFGPLLAGISPWLRAGAIFHTLTFSQEGESSSSERGTGFEGRVGLNYPIPALEALRVSPSLGYRAYSAKFDLEVGATDPSRTVAVSYLSADLGVSFTF
ncbi:MAG: hypothetical protein ACREKN_05050 [Longimicrobiaceae bacterium]